MDIQELAEKNQAIAWEIIRETGVIEAWECIGATVNLVGSLKSGLLTKNKDIDMHIYTEKLSITESFGVIEKLAENPFFREIQYINGIDTEEECIEWHLRYESPEAGRWKMDMIHIRKGSRYDGWIEKVTDAVARALTPETRLAIMRIKYEMPEDKQIMGVEIYRGVLSGGVRSYEEFVKWHKENPIANTLEWIP